MVYNVQQNNLSYTCTQSWLQLVSCRISASDRGLGAS